MVNDSPHFFPSKNPNLGGSWGAAAGAVALPAALVGEEGKKGRVGEKGPAAQDIGLVAPARMARQIASVAPVHVARQCGHAGGPS